MLRFNEKSLVLPCSDCKGKGTPSCDPENCEPFLLFNWLQNEGDDPRPLPANRKKDWSKKERVRWLKERLPEYGTGKFIGSDYERAQEKFDRQDHVKPAGYEQNPLHKQEFLSSYEIAYIWNRIVKECFKGRRDRKSLLYLKFYLGGMNEKNIASMFNDSPQNVHNKLKRKVRKIIRKLFQSNITLQETPTPTEFRKQIMLHFPVMDWFQNFPFKTFDLNKKSKRTSLKSTVPHPKSKS